MHTMSKGIRKGGSVVPLDIFVAVVECVFTSLVLAIAVLGSLYAAFFCSVAAVVGGLSEETRTLVALGTVFGGGAATWWLLAGCSRDTAAEADRLQRAAWKKWLGTALELGLFLAICAVCLWGLRIWGELGSL